MLKVEGDGDFTFDSYTDFVQLVFLGMLYQNL